jgi:molybdopterin-guanine dinucleotide biosynthesis protein A
MALIVTLLINAGGKSRRMGEAKALLPVPPGEMPLIRHIGQRLLGLVDAVVVVANDPAICTAVAPLQARCLPDTYPESGPLGGLATGLEAVEGWALCVACDLPLVQPRLFQYLIALAEEGDESGVQRWDAIVPYVEGRPQPLHALYHRRCLPAIVARLEAGERRVDSFFDDIRLRRVTEDEVRRLDPDLHSFFNANTTDEWQHALAQLVDESPST